MQEPSRGRAVEEAGQEEEEEGNKSRERRGDAAATLHHLAVAACTAGTGELLTTRVLDL